MTLGPLRDLEPRADPKGGSPKTPPGGISLSVYKKFIAEHSDELKVSLKEHFESKLGELDRRLTEAQRDAKEAIKVATAAQEKRLDLLNEFRGQASDESKKYALKEVVDKLSIQVSMLYGGVVVVGIIGIANLVKLFWGK